MKTSLVDSVKELPVGAKRQISGKSTFEPRAGIVAYCPWCRDRMRRTIEVHGANDFGVPNRANPHNSVFAAADIEKRPILRKDNPHKSRAYGYQGNAWVCATNVLE